MPAPYEDEAISFRSGANSSFPINYWVSVANRRIDQSATSRGKQYELDTVQTGSYNPTYDNRDGWLSPMNSSSPYYPNVTPYRPVRKRMQYPATQNMLTANQASAGQASLVSGVDAPVAAGGSVPQVFSAVTGGPAVTASATAFEGANVFQNTIPASQAPNSLLIWVTGFSVLPGSPHTFSMYVRTPTGSSALTAQLALTWVNVAATAPTTVTGTAVTLPVASNTWTRLTVTGTPPAAAVGAYVSLVNTNSPAASFNLQADGLQLEYAAAATPWVKPGTWYPLFNGWIDRWPLRWDNGGLFNKTAPEAVDSFGYLSQTYLKPPFYADVLALGPNFFYTFDQGQGAQYATDLSRNNKPPAPVVDSPFGPGSLTFGNSVQATKKPTLANPAGGGFLGGASSVATFANVDDTLSYNTKEAATTIDLTGLGGPVAGASGYYTRLIAWRVNGVPPTAFQYMWAWNIASYAPPYGGTNGFGIFGTYGPAGVPPTPDGSPCFVSNTSTSTNGAPFRVVPKGTNMCTGDWHLQGVIVNPTAGTAQNIWDGTVEGVASGLTSLNITPTTLGGDAVGAAVVKGTNVVQNAFAGDVAFVIEFPFALSGQQVSDLWRSFQVAWAGESSAQRYSRILGYAGYPGSKNVTTSPGTTTMGPASDIAQGGQKATTYSPVTGVDVQTALQNVVTTENGNHFVAADGTITFQSRTSRYGIFTPAIIFGENPTGSGEIPYETCEFDFDTARVANDVQVTQYVGSTVYEVLAPASQQQYGTRTLTRTINDGAYQSNDAASYLAYKYANPGFRLKTMRIHVSANPSIWPVALALELGNRARVIRRDLANTITWDGFIEQIKWTFDYSTNEVFLELQMSPADKSAFWQLSALHTTLTTAAAAGATSITINPLPNAATIPVGGYIPGDFAGTSDTVSVGAYTSGGTTYPAFKIRVGAGSGTFEEVAVTSYTCTGGTRATNYAGKTVPGQFINYTSVTFGLAAPLANSYAVNTTVSEALPAGTTDPVFFDATSNLGTSTIIGY